MLTAAAATDLGGVGSGLSYGTDDHSLRDEFAKYGQVIEAKIILDRESGRSRGFGFITYTSSEEASAAITAMDGKDIVYDLLILVRFASSALI
ncbi:glycine-rich protein2 [Zea mays]|uniref:Glycine-rich protein2 n=1 Tax=Zea mays TaxID=4577 RepID=A0A1D6IV86_MAIZE|nr:glycine-rich protein2 [Zea mays]